MGELREFHFSDADFRQIQALIRQRAGINLSDNKSNLVYSRLARRLRALGLQQFTDYLAYLAERSDELENFINALTTNHTSFFREPHHFEELARYIEQRKKRPLKVWCAASSTGEEPYSIAMTLVEAYGTWSPPARILATDIDSQVLEHARKGVYSLERISSLAPERKKQFFQRGLGPRAGYARINPALRSMVSFKKLNLLDQPWPLTSHFDIIFCRNVMIYFDKPTQLNLLTRMMKVLTPGGLYFAGHSESFVHATHVVRLIGKSTYVSALSGESNDPG